MRFAIIYLAVAGLVAAVDHLQDIPVCARPCIEAIYPVVGCQLSDLHCACNKKHQQKIAWLAKDCVIGKCGIIKALEAKDKAKKKCNELLAKGEKY